MAKTKTPDFIDQLRATGLRRKVAESVSDALGSSKRSRPSKRLRSIVDDLRKVADDIEDRATGGKRSKRRAAAQKGVRTRQARARARSEAAKRGARTRAARSK